jgi:drug/metabolite transporter (DMT)-like permease
MIQGGNIITTLIFSKILLNIIIQKRHIWGCGFAFIGLLIVAGSGFIENQSGTGQVVKTLTI